jgi:DNA-binding transcriptional regulator LsrR (DeoR family)
MSDKGTNERLDKIIKRLDTITVIMLAQSGMKRKEIADALGVSEKTIGRLIPVSRIKGKGKRAELEQPTNLEEEPNEQQ